MRLIQKIVLIINVMVFTFFVTISIQKNIVNAEEKKYETEYAIYEETEVVTNQMLGYGINHINTKAITTAKRCTNTNSSLIVDSPQNVNILSVPSAKNIRVINYTYLDDDGWSKQTLSKMVENFELNNPGWTVIAGVNGDFYDINGNDKALPYHTTGTTVTNNDVLRAVESKSIGYFNDGTTDSFIIVDEASFTNHHILTIYDENDDVIATYNVDKINESPSNDELAIYYTYRVNKDTDGDNVVDNCDEIKDCFVKELLGKLAHKEQECEELKKYETYYLDKYIALKDVLAKIKEIAEDFYLDGEHVKDKYLAQEILQKIYEVDNENK